MVTKFFPAIGYVPRVVSPETAVVQLTYVLGLFGIKCLQSDVGVFAMSSSKEVHFVMCGIDWDKAIEYAERIKPQ